MNFYFIDDDQSFLDTITYEVTKYSIKENIDICILTSNSIPKHIPDNIDAFFLDIEIGNEKIFEFSKKIRKKNIYTPIIFCSNFDHYIYDSVKIHIFDYLRKKDFLNEINITMTQLIKYIGDSSLTISFYSDKMMTKLKLKEIIYIEAYSHNSVIHSLRNTYTVNKGIKDIFGDKIKSLCKIHKSYYVNLDYIIACGKTFILLENLTKLPVGKNYKKEVYKMYMENHKF